LKKEKKKDREYFPFNCEQSIYASTKRKEGSHLCRSFGTRNRKKPVAIGGEIDGVGVSLSPGDRKQRGCVDWGRKKRKEKACRSRNDMSQEGVKSKEEACVVRFVEKGSGGEGSGMGVKCLWGG